MFWGKDKKQSNKTSDKRSPSKKGKAAKERVCVGKNNGHGTSREEIHAQAMANFSSAKQNIGEDTLERIAAAMNKKQQLHGHAALHA